MVKYGCTDVDLFQTADLYEGKDIAAVTNSIFALGRQVRTWRHCCPNDVDLETQGWVEVFGWREM